MSIEYAVVVPDIGDFDDVEVIEILVAIGEVVAVESPLVTLESDKATMDIPAPRAGIIIAINVALGDKVAEGSVIVTIAADDAESEVKTEKMQQPNGVSAAPAVEAELATPSTKPLGTQREANVFATTLTEVSVPDIGDFDEVDVIEILVGPGDLVQIEDSLITLESDKATMDIPAPIAGRVETVLVAVGDKISEGHVIVTITPSVRATATAPPPLKTTSVVQSSSVATQTDNDSKPTLRTSIEAYASPSIRKFARELGVNLSILSGTGRKGRILKVDVQAHVKETLSAPGDKNVNGVQIMGAPAIDFAKFGPVETLGLSKIKRLTGQSLHRSWIMAPHVTQFDAADITELDVFRKSKIKDAEEQGVKLTLLAFLIKAVIVGLKEFPDFNASLSIDGTSIIRKQYFNIGIAVNTDRGLVVPVIRDADKKGLYELAGELASLSGKARDKKLRPADMQGGCFTISSLGGIGGSAFTPIINVPEVAILGVSSAAIKPVYIESEFAPRLMLPISLSYDHRVIDGVAGAQFTSALSLVLSDIRQLLL
jgi:pyruvate dehydrogenase E2 component (dihydrolipoamide acetyltransferase)